MKGLLKLVLSIATLWLACVSSSAQQEAQPSSLTLEQAVTAALKKNKEALANPKLPRPEFVRRARSSCLT